MLDFSDKNYRTILKEMLEQVTNSLDKREGSMIQTALGPAAWYMEGIYMDLEHLQQNSFAITAVGEALDMKALERGLYRKKAAPAVRKGQFNIKVPIGSRFSAMGDTEYATYVVTGYIGLEDGQECFELTCETSGNLGNNYTGDILPITYIAGLNKAVLTDILIPGTEEETDEALRERYIESLTEKPFGGNISAYRTEIMKIDGVGAVQIYPVWKGGGTVLCSILDSNYNAATEQLIQKVQEEICPPEEEGRDPSEKGYGMAPIGAIVTISTAEEVKTDISAVIQLQPGYTAESVRDGIEKSLEEYLLSVRKSWGKGSSKNKIEYAVSVYIARINYAILNIDGIVNVTEITINGSDQDLICVETGELQQIPVLGVLTLNES